MKNQTVTFSRFVLAAVAVVASLNVVTPAAQAQRYSGVASRPNQTLLSLNLSGAMTVYVNGRTVGTFSETVSKRDISAYVRRGQNTLRVVLKPGSNTGRFNIDGVPNGFVRVAHAYRKNEFKDLTKILFGAEMRGRAHKYDYSTTFTLDSLTPGATGAREYSGGQAPMRSGYNSRPNQTVLTINTSGDTSVFVNGRKVETFSDTVMKRDISRFVRPGSNTLLVKLHQGTNSAAGARDGVPSGFVRIGYAQRQDQFREVGKVFFGPSLPRQRHKLEYRSTFTVGG